MNDELRASYLHEIDATHEHYQALMLGVMSRWIETAIDALTADTPKVYIAIERLDMLRNLIHAERK